MFFCKKKTRENEFESDPKYEYWPPYCLLLSFLVVMNLIGSARTFPPPKSIMSCMLVVTNYQEGVASFNFAMQRIRSKKEQSQ